MVGIDCRRDTCMTAVIADDITFRHNTSIDFANFDVKNADQHHTMVVHAGKQNTFAEFKVIVASRLGISSAELRFWLIVLRLNHTVRIDMPVPEEEISSSTYHAMYVPTSNVYIALENICKNHSYSCNAGGCLRLYMEKATMHDELQNPIFPPPPPLFDVGEFSLLFVKLFKPQNQSIQ